MTAAPTPRSVLGTLTKARVAELARDLGVALAAAPTREIQVEALLRRRPVELPAILDVLGRDVPVVAILTHLGLPADPPPIARARDPAEMTFGFR